MHARPLLPLAAALALAACATPPSPIPTAEPTPAPTAAPVATPSPIPAGPLPGTGPVSKAEYETPTGFAPRFGFSLMGEGWRSIVEPDELGFVLATPNVASIHALIGVLVPVATTLDDFSAELEASGYLTEAAIVEDLQIDGVVARSWTQRLAESHDAFRIHSADGEVMAAFGGALPDNRIVFAAAPDRAFVVVFSSGPNASTEDQFAMARFLGTIAFR